MIDYVAALRDFSAKHRAFVLPAPGVPPDAVIELRKDLIDEEKRELYAAMDLAAYEATKENLVAVADALADLLYVVFGTALAFGIPIDQIFTEVQRSNMTKTPGYLAPNGKILKGPDFEPPKLEPILFPNEVSVYEQHQ